MATRFYLRLPNPAQARGSDPDLAFHSDGAEGFAEELQAALRTPVLFERWRRKQDDPDAIDDAFAATDPVAIVRGEQHDLSIDLIVTTSLPGDVFKQRLRWLAGGGWQLRDVSAA
ncbi:hypothetical protein [Arenimonas oryziterrae]|uniref:Uncharacterized protein n=1 Tax=Arenimonas oryziterrae DSM 21050 = YC6267 TaxID=1121015 RepID=A0A091AQ21_9GAMM|nr:hypothetical protein [Arenimonas oryziterrae]KFN42273.1 hypothetical protein N789_14410 [Arenimonas oryziterrae DSM 21050 = YC6267]